MDVLPDGRGSSVVRPCGFRFGSIGTLYNLEHLDLSCNDQLYFIPESIGNLRKLHTLNLSGCYDLQELPDSMVEMVSLKVIHLEKFGLNELAAFQLNCAALPHIEVHASSDKCSSNLNLLQHINPEDLTIDRLENVRSVKEAQSIKLVEKQKIVKLGFEWTEDAGRFVDDKEVLEKLVPPSSVQKLSIGGYRSVSLPDWLMGIWQYLPNLLELCLADFPKCKRLPAGPALGQLPNLKKLHLYHMENLEEWNETCTSAEEGTNEMMFPKLEALTIVDCPRLKIKPCLLRAMCLDINNSNNVLSSWGESLSHNGDSSSSPVTHLSVRASKVPIQKWRLLHQLPALCTLTISCCSDLTASPEIIQHLPSLKELCITELPLNQTSLPHWLGQLTSLEILNIDDCTGIRSLPDNIQQLSKLEYLAIHSCDTLRKWCQSEENRMNLAHIREISLRWESEDIFNVHCLKAKEKSRLDNFCKAICNHSYKVEVADADDPATVMMRSLAQVSGEQAKPWYQQAL